MFRDENKKTKTKGLQRMILFVEIFANVKRFDFEIFIKWCKLLNETKTFLFPLVAFHFQICDVINLQALMKV